MFSLWLSLLRSLKWLIPWRRYFLLLRVHVGLWRHVKRNRRASVSCRRGKDYLSTTRRHWDERHAFIDRSTQLHSLLFLQAGFPQSCILIHVGEINMFVRPLFLLLLWLRWLLETARQVRNFSFITKSSSSNDWLHRRWSLLVQNLNERVER